MNRLDDEIKQMVTERIEAAPPPPSVAKVQRYADELALQPSRDRPSRPGTAFRMAAMAASIVAVIALGATLLTSARSDRLDVEPSASVDTSPPTTIDAVRPTTSGDPEFPLVEIDPDGITIAAGALFGFTPGRGTGPDDVLPVVNERLGEPDYDTGWIEDAADMQPCAELSDYREIWWGDLSMGFWGKGSATYFHYWVTGDRRAVWFILPEIDVPTPTSKTDLTTDQGIVVGDSIDAIPQAPNVDRADFENIDGNELTRTSVISTIPGADPTGINPTSRAGSYHSVDGEIIAFGGESLTC